MKTKAEIEVELLKVRALLARLRAARPDSDDDGTEIMYGAQQALSWVLGTGMAASVLQDLIEELAEMLPAEP